MTDAFSKLARQYSFSIEAARQDMSLPVLRDLLAQGYTSVRWDSGPSKHGKCLDLNNQTWSLDDFISNLSFDAPIFERSHPGDASCSVVVSGPSVPDVRVDSEGNVF